MGPDERRPRDEEFTSFVATRWTALLRTGYLLTGDRATAEDLVQTALTKTYVAWGRLRDVSAAEPYVKRTMVTTFTSWWRRHRGRERTVPEVADRAGVVRDRLGRDGAAEDLESVLSRSVLWPHLAALPRGQRAAVVLRFYEDLSEIETAEALGCSVGTVKSQTHRALTTLRAAMRDGVPVAAGAPPAAGSPTTSTSTTEGDPR